jgi:hypothetical protein
VVAVATSSAFSGRERTKLAMLAPFARLLGAYLVLPNALFIIAGRFVFLARATINVDYLLLGCLAPLLPRRIVGIVFTVLLVIDSVLSFAPVFHFDLAAGAIPIVGALTSRLLLYPLTLAMAIAIVVVALIAERLSRIPTQRFERIALMVTTAFAISLDVIAGTNSVQKTDGGLLGFNVGTSAIYFGARVVLRALSTSDPPPNIEPVMSATSALRQEAINEVTPRAAVNIVLVIVESLGHFRTEGSDSTLFAPLLTPAIYQLYDVRLGTVPAHGATTSGELRELCGLRGDFLAIGHMKTKECLPAILAGKGYVTTAFHGYSRALYGRMTWYPEVGFQRMWFGEDLSQLPDTRLCGTTFHGVCDEDVARILETQLLHSRVGQRNFLYWLTLDSHLPVDVTNVPQATFSCDRLPQTQRFSDVCNLVRLYERVLSTIAEWATRPDLPATRFIVVGDHAPPFFSREKRSFFADSEVPFLELVPRPPTSTKRTAAAAPYPPARPVR